TPTATVASTSPCIPTGGESAVPATSSPAKTLLFVVLAVTLLVATRLPVLLGPASSLDGDEAILGLMAKHMTEGRFSLFFYGQGYAFAFVEAGLAALFFVLFGMSEIALHAAILTLWAAGAVFLALAALRMGNRRPAMTTALLA